MQNTKIHKITLRGLNSRLLLASGYAAITSTGMVIKSARATRFTDTRKDILKKAIRSMPKLVSIILIGPYRPNTSSRMPPMMTHEIKCGR